MHNFELCEICIRYNIKGETVFFVADEFDKKFMTNYATSLITASLAKLCIMAWVDYTEESYIAEFYLLGMKTK